MREPAGTNSPDIVLPPSGTTRSRPVELVGLSRITSFRIALSKGSLPDKSSGATQLGFRGPGKALHSSLHRSSCNLESLDTKSIKFVIVLLVVSLPPTIKLIASAMISSAGRGPPVSGSFAFNRKLIKSLREVDSLLRRPNASRPIISRFAVDRRPVYQNGSSRQYFMYGLIHRGTCPKAFKTSPRVSTLWMRL